MPPTPKPNGQRRRRNAVPGIATLAKSGREGPAPEPETSVVLCDVARRYWDAIWASPMALVYTDVDVFPLSRMAVLVHERETERSTAGDSELRQLEDRFGVSPLARRRLNWEIDQAGKAAQDADDAPAPRPTRTKGDPRLTLAS
jgi:hypothetical protein